MESSLPFQCPSCQHLQVSPYCVLLGAVFGLFFLLTLALVVLAYCRIFSKAGYPWVLGLLALVPLANVIVLLFLAFADWPVLKQLKQLKNQAGPTST